MLNSVFILTVIVLFFLFLQRSNLQIIIHLKKNRMKTIYFIQTFHLNQGIITMGKFAFNSIHDAHKHIRDLKRIYSETEELSLEDIEKKYVFNILTAELY